MKAPSQAERYQLVHNRLTTLLEAVLAGDLIEDRATAERLVCVLGAAISLHEHHAVDERGRCALCRPIGRWWRRRQRCLVHTEFAFYLAQPGSLAITAISGQVAEKASNGS